MDNETLELEGEFKVQPISIKGVGSFTLREFSGEQRDAYWDSVSKRAKFDEKGAPIPGTQDYKGFQAETISACLFGEDNVRVTATTINGWPAATVAALFKAAQKLNGLGAEKEAAEAQAKKD